VWQVLGASPDDTAFARATLPREFVFPDDHGPHESFRNEWWYWTGNLEGPAGRRFGYQLTVFRSALAKERTPGRTSAWAANQVYLAHFALTDASSGEFYASERTSRAALDLAGAAARPFRVWVLDWSASGPEPGDVATPIRLRAAGDDFSIDLSLDQGKPPVLEGDRGLSRKGSTPGNASYYYSLTRMPTRGELTVPGGTFSVRGESWMDREWSTSALESGQVGWDWFALQLSDGRDVMFYRLRRADGSTDEASSGTIVDADGNIRHLAHGEVTIEQTGTWKSPRTGASYPAGFRLKVPGEGLELAVTPLIADQELDLTFRYWEGAVSVHAANAPISGRGYLELTGYGDFSHLEP
jgi:predicted secreted hydrolase